VATEGQQLWGGLWAGALGRLGAAWAIAASCTRKVTRPAGWRLGAMPFPGDRAVLAPCCDFCTIRRHQIGGASPIGNLIAESGLPRRSPNGTWTASRIVRPVQACGIRGPTTAACWALIDLARSRKTDRTFV